MRIKPSARGKRRAYRDDRPQVRGKTTRHSVEGGTEGLHIFSQAGMRGGQAARTAAVQPERNGAAADAAKRRGRTHFFTGGN